MKTLLTMSTYEYPNKPIQSFFILIKNKCIKSCRCMNQAKKIIVVDGFTGHLKWQMRNGIHFPKLYN
ncbi:hypothetical protein RchiOBHm_Chr5g0078981 [Rosa chinensis]|uniref:Uncharacterized protein n=1 Tax=Rosa chinensis TaxID=74649 RepID=A0A2P6QME8_ROSCH|nr:hypothetical protein RchiOBHm_Chr5g0078981 [Rosa chinensis]